MGAETPEARVVPGLSVPLIGGLTRPTLLLPVESLDWSPGRLRSVFLHEAAHLARRDPRTTVLARVAAALHWPDPLVWWALSEPDPYVREMIVRAVGEHEDPRSVSTLVEILGDPVGEVRAAAVWALGEVGTASALDAVRGGLTDADPRVRRTAADALGRSGSLDGPDPLVQALTDSDVGVRRAAAARRGELGSSEAVAALVAPSPMPMPGSVPGRRAPSVESAIPVPSRGCSRGCGTTTLRSARG